MTAQASENNQISQETQRAVDQLINEYPNCETYINSVIDGYMDADDIEDINPYIEDAINGVIECNKLAKERVLKEELKNDLIFFSEYGTNSDAYTQLIGTYYAGIQIVKAKGCPQTAKYMEHAIVPEGSTTNPGTYTSNGDSWAADVCNADSMMSSVTDKFESQILSKGKTSGTVTGSITYDKNIDGLDLFAALHAVSYAVTFNKTSNGYSANFYVVDTYDFKKEKYEDFAIDFANNYCYVCQSLGYIRPFEIVITYKA